MARGKRHGLAEKFRELFTRQFARSLPKLTMLDAASALNVSDLHVVGRIGDDQLG
jgi:hypothetical protein